MTALADKHNQTLSARRIQPVLVYETPSSCPLTTSHFFTCRIDLPPSHKPAPPPKRKQELKSHLTAEDIQVRLPSLAASPFPWQGKHEPKVQTERGALDPACSLQEGLNSERAGVQTGS